MTRDNPYCRALGIPVPRVEDVVGRSEANIFGLLFTTLLEHGGPMTLEEVAQRFEQAGVASSARALESLRRCRPATRPIHRDDALYELDPHDHEARLWVGRLRLRPRPTRARGSCAARAPARARDPADPPSARPRRRARPRCGARS